MAPAENENTLWDEIGYKKQQSEPTTQADVDEATTPQMRWIPPIGDYLVELIAAVPREGKYKGDRVVKVQIRAQIVLPQEFSVTPKQKDAVVSEYVFPMAPGEEDWMRNQRIGFLTKTGLCPNQPAALDAFDWREINEGGKFYRHRCVLMIGHNTFVDNENGSLVATTTGRDFIPWRPQSFWGSPECQMPPIANVNPRGFDDLPAQLRDVYTRTYGPGGTAYEGIMVNANQAPPAVAAPPEDRFAAPPPSGVTPPAGAAPPPDDPYANI